MKLYEEIQTYRDTMTMTINDQQLASPPDISIACLAQMIRGVFSDIFSDMESRMIKRWNDMDSRMIKRLNDMAAVPEDLATIDIQEAVREVVTTNPIATETKDKEADETNDNDVEKVEKVEIIGGFSTSGVSTDATEILEENEDKVNETFNILDPNIRDKGGGGRYRTDMNNCKVTKFKCKN